MIPYPSSFSPRLILLPALLAGCAGAGTGAVSAGVAPASYALVLIGQASDHKDIVTRVLIDRGYTVLLGWKLTDLEPYQVRAGTVLHASCFYLGHVQKALGGTAARVSCELVDAATAAAVYAGQGEYMGLSVDADLSGAYERALANLPSTGRLGAVTQVPSFALRAQPPPVVPVAPAPTLTPDRGPSILGTGFVVDTTGSVLTNAHIVHGCRQLSAPRLSSPGVALVRADTANDLALVRLQERPAGVLNFRERPAIRPGDQVVAVGFPLQGFVASEPSVTTGNVSALAGPGDDARFLQITTPLQPGNSGGPVLDLAGNVVGIVVAQLDALRVARVTGAFPQNVNFAIHGSIAKAFLDAAGVSYATASSTAHRDQADVAQLGRRAVVLLACSK